MAKKDVAKKITITAQDQKFCMGAGCQLVISGLKKVFWLEVFKYTVIFLTFDRKITLFTYLATAWPKKGVAKKDVAKKITIAAQDQKFCMGVN